MSSATSSGWPPTGWKRTLLASPYRFDSRAEGATRREDSAAGSPTLRAALRRRLSISILRSWSVAPGFCRAISSASPRSRPALVPFATPPVAPPPTYRFLAAARERSAHGRGLPAFVERELRAYLDCGILARGFARVRCPDCGFERLVAFSCKAHVCPSCATRRMEDGADHLVRNVLPPVPVRQWVLSLPRRVRFLAARRPALASRLLAVFTRAVFAWQRRSARRLGAVDPRTGGMTAIQRFGGALNLNVHFHTVIPDGVFVAAGDGPARHFPIAQPRDEDVAAILARVDRRTAAALVGPDEDLASEEDALAALQAAEVERRLRYPEPFEGRKRGAFLDGFSLHAGARIHASDRDGRERLCRYILRPPLARHRLSRGEDGGLLYRMKRSRHGSLWLSLTPEGLLARLATLVPPPRVHAVRYHGVFAPHAGLRSRVVPDPPEDPAPS